MEDKKTIIGKKVSVIIDRPFGSAHPEYQGMIYPVNYGYIREIKAGDGKSGLLRNERK